MASIRRTLIGIGLLFLTVPPPNASPASSDVQGNVGPTQPGPTQPGPTQSGPGAAGLFTPSSPGNAAAYNAQVQGGLTASPIVDGNGANIRVTVPMATPSAVPNYRQYSTGAGNAVGGNSLMPTDGGQPAPGATQLNKPANLDVPGAANAPASINGGAVKSSPISASARDSRRPLTPRPGARRTVANYQRLPQFRKPKTSPIGDITGAITYGDGQKVLLGSEGTAIVSPHDKQRR